MLFVCRLTAVRMYIFLKRVMGSDGCDGFMIILAGMEGMEGMYSFKKSFKGLH